MIKKLNIAIKLISLCFFTMLGYSFFYLDPKQALSTSHYLYYLENKSVLFYIAGGLILSLIITSYLKKIMGTSKIRKAQKGLNHLSWREFEELTNQLYKKRGFTSRVIGGSGGDGGIDVLLKRKGKKYIVQCKHWKTSKVGIKVVRELFGVMIHEKADGVKIIATSGFTKECYKFVRGKSIELIDGNTLRSML